MNKKIFIFLDSSLFGGIEAHIIELAKLLMSQKLSVTVLFYQDHQNQQVYQALTQLQCPYHCLNGTFTDLYRFFNNQDHEFIVHTHGYKAGILARICSKPLKFQCISTYHAGEAGTGKVKLYNSLDKFTSFLSKNFVVNDALKTEVNNAEVVNNFVHFMPEKLNYRFKDNLNIAFVGRLSYEKGPDIFAQLATEMKEFTQLSFHIYGDGPMRGSLDSLATSNLELKGHQANTDFWQEIDILMITSREEGLPMVLLEAMNRGIPVITTAVGAIPNVISHGYNGILSEHISCHALAAALNHWLTLSAACQLAITCNAKSDIKQNYSGKQQLQQYLKAYQMTL